MQPTYSKPPDYGFIVQVQMDFSTTSAIPLTKKLFSQPVKTDINSSMVTISINPGTRDGIFKIFLLVLF